MASFYFKERNLGLMKPKKLQPLVCACGTKYIKAKPDQTTCFWCRKNLPNKHSVRK